MVISVWQTQKHSAMYCALWKNLVTASLLSPLGSSKSKQSSQFDPAKQAHKGKVGTWHERRNRSVTISGTQLEMKADVFCSSEECSLTALSAEVQLPITSSYFGLHSGRAFLGHLKLLLFPTYISIHQRHTTCNRAQLHQFPISNSRHCPKSQCNSWPYQVCCDPRCH